MLHYNRIDISEGIDLMKNNNSKESMICHYWFFNHRFNFQDYVCNQAMQEFSKGGRGGGISNEGGSTMVGGNVTENFEN